MSNNRARNRMARRGAPPPPRQAQPQNTVLPRGGNGAPRRRRRVEQALENETIPVDPARRPAPRERSKLLSTDASAAALQEIAERLVGIENVAHGMVHALRVQLGLSEADDELESLRSENTDLREQLDAALQQLDQIRASVGVTTPPTDAPRPTPQHPVDQTDPQDAEADSTPTPPEG